MTYSTRIIILGLLIISVLILGTKKTTAAQISYQNPQWGDIATTAPNNNTCTTNDLIGGRDGNSIGRQQNDTNDYCINRGNISAISWTQRLTDLPPIDNEPSVCRKKNDGNWAQTANNTFIYDEIVCEDGINTTGSGLLATAMIDCTQPICSTLVGSGSMAEICYCQTYELSVNTDYANYKQNQTSIIFEQGLYYIITIGIALFLLLFLSLSFFRLFLKYP